MADAGLLVIGSGPAGIGAAEGFRRLNSGAPVRILTADTDPPYARPPLSKEFLRGDTEDIGLHPAQWFDDRGLQIILDAAVEHLDPVQRTVTAAGRSYGYDSVVIASGAGPAPLAVPGAHHAVQLRSRRDAERLRAAAGSAATAVVIGSGFIGCEVAASLAMKGLSVDIVSPEAIPQQHRLGDAAGHKLLDLLRDTGARFTGGAAVTEIRAESVMLDDGDVRSADLIVAATGIRPNSGIAEAAGIPLQHGRIPVGLGMRTPTAGVYAAGDVALCFNMTARRPLRVEHWQDAADQGEAAGVSAAGGEGSWSGVPGFWTTIGEATVKYHAWGDGYDESRLVERENGFTVWYQAAGAAVGVLTYNADEDYDMGGRLIAAGKPAP